MNLRLHSLNYRTMILFIFMLLLMLIYKSTNYRRHLPDLHYRQKRNRTIDYLDANNKFLINTYGCQIPKSEILNYKLQSLMNKFHEKIRRPYCQFINKNYRPFLIDSNEHSLFVVEDAVQFYKKDKNVELKCSYLPFWKSEPDDITSVTYGEPIYFSKSAIIPPLIQFVKVNCYVNDTEVYTDFHAFVPPTESKSDPKLNVLIYGMDSVSRINFHRQMPRTDKLLKKLSFIEYYGYNKVADNTFPNLVPFLTGHSVEKLRSLCWPTQPSYFDDCPFIWKKYKNAGYTTSYAEDQNYLSTFYFEKSGFIKSPTDHYYFPFDREASSMAHNYVTSINLCLGSRLSAEILLNYATKMISTLRNHPLFAFFWEVGLSHDDLNLPSIGDTLHEDFFENLQNLGYLNTSIIIFLSDHGIRHGEILETTEGYLEVRLPLFTVSFPPWFAEQYPLAYDNFITNARRLTTPFDAHKMLEDLSNLQTIEDEEINRRTIELNTSTPHHGISLFLPIPETRTCQQAGIPDIYCSCLQKSSDIVLNSKLTQNSAMFLLQKINDKLTEYPRCSRLMLRRINKAKFLTLTEDETIKIVIIILTAPGNGLFEGMIQYDQDADEEMKLIGTINRINAYGRQGYCVHVPEMKLYCYCK